MPKLRPLSSTLMAGGLLLIVAATGCPGSSDHGTLHMDVTPARTIAEVGDVVAYTAVPVGDPVTDFQWSVGTAGIARIQSSTDHRANVRAEAPGETTIEVQGLTHGGRTVEGLARLTVVPQGTPVIVAVTPTSGTVGSRTTFSADVTNNPTGFNWDFGAAATPSTSTEASPTVDLGAAGTHPITVTASNDIGTSPAFTFNLVVSVAGNNPPIVQSVSPTGGVGEPGASVTFTVLTDVPALSWNWNFGGGATPNTSTEENPTVTLGTQGAKTGTVSVGNEHGSSADFGFNFHVTGPPGEFVKVTFGDFHHPLDSITPFAATVIEDEIWVTYDLSDNPANEIRVARSQPNPRSADDFFIHGIGSSDLAGTAPANPQIAVGPNGRVVVVWQDLAGETTFAVANTDTPTTGGDWTLNEGPPVTLGQVPGAFRTHNNRLILGHGTPASGVSLAVSTTATPAGPGDWVSHAIIPGVGQWRGNLIARPNGRLATAWTLFPDQPFVALAKVGLPAATVDWDVTAVANSSGAVSPGFTNQASIAALGDTLLVAWGTNFQGSPAQQVAITTVANPILQTDWTAYQIDPTTGGMMTVLAYDGRFSIAYSGANGIDGPIKHSRALVGVPTDMGQWSTRLHDTLTVDTVPVLLGTSELLGMVYSDVNTRGINWLFSDNP